MTEESRPLDTQAADLEKQYYALFEQKVALDRALVRSTRGLSQTRNTEENLEIRRKLIGVLEELSPMAERLSTIPTAQDPFTSREEKISYREWAAAYAGEAAYHKEMLELLSKDPDSFSSSEVFTKALEVKKTATAAVASRYSDAA